MHFSSSYTHLDNWNIFFNITFISIPDPPAKITFFSNIVLIMLLYSNQVVSQLYSHTFSPSIKNYLGF